MSKKTGLVDSIAAGVGGIVGGAAGIGAVVGLGTGTGGAVFTTGLVAVGGSMLGGLAAVAAAPLAGATIAYGAVKLMKK